MIQRLFFGFLDEKIKTVKLILQFIIVMLPILSFANSTELIDSPSEITPPQTQNPTKIYVSQGATIVGVENISNLKIVSDTKTVQKKVKPVEKLTLSEEIQHAVVLKNVKEKEIKAATEKNIAKKTDFTFSNPLQSNSNFSQKSGNSLNAVFSPTNLLQKAAITSQYVINLKISAELKKQKIYNSLSYLQFRKYRSSSLRAPPAIS